MSPNPHPSPSGAALELPLAGLLVVALEQAVAAPYCSSRLADAGARVIKIERPEGDLQLLRQMIARADVFIQNLAPGAAQRLGLGSAALRALHPRLITCDISGYGDRGRLYQMKAYDLLVQAESGLVSVSGAPGEWGRIGVSLCDINAGLNALVGIHQALLLRTRTGCGSAVKVSLFDSAAELTAVPYLQARYGGKAPARVGLKHPSIAPYGGFACADGRDIVISIQNEREWAEFAQVVLQQPALLEDPRCANNAARVQHREWLDGVVGAVFAAHTSAEMIDLLTDAQTAYGSVNSLNDLIEHPQLRTRRMPVGPRSVEMPATPWASEWDRESFRAAPTVDQHGAAIRAEFAVAALASAQSAQSVLAK